MTERQATYSVVACAGPDTPAYFAWRVVGLSFCLLMICVHIVVGLNSGGVPDSWRDMYWATAIAHGEQFPASGPPIYRLFELGPWWFYVVALPIWLTGKTAIASAFVQVLAGAKYLLAWRLGTQVVDARFGLVFSASLAVAGWSTASGLFPTHTAVVETALLLLAMATWRCWRQLTTFNTVLLGLAAAVCVHTHPTTVFYIICAGLVLLFRRRSWRAFFLLGGAAAIVILSLLPPLLDSSSILASARTPVVAYVGDDIGVDPWRRIPALLESLALGGAWFGFLLMTKWSLTTAKVAWWVYAGCLLFAATGITRLRGAAHRTLRVLFVAALVMFLGDAVFLAMVRPITPIWMVPSALPPLALATAVGWYGWLSAERRMTKWVSMAALLVFVSLSLAPFALLLRHLHSARVAPGVNPYLDIISSSDRYVSIPVPFVSARQLDRLGGELCEPAVLHGRLAAAIEQSLGTTVRNACGHWPRLRYGGIDGAGQHIAGVLPSAVDAIGIAPTRVIGGIAFYERVRAIAPASGGHPTRLARMQVDPDGPSGEASRIVHDFDTRGGDVVMLTDRLPMAAPMTARSVTVDGRAASLVHDDGASWAYACRSCAADVPVRWHVEFEGIEQGTDLVVLFGGSAGTSQTNDSPAR